MKQGVKIAIIGPESTGKTQLAKELALMYDGFHVPEYARAFIANLQRPYTYNDVVTIAEKIIEDWNNHLASVQPVFFDTEMILTKIWFEVAFNKTPSNIQTWIETMQFDAFLLCKDDLPWIPDPVRENGGAMRKILFNKYRDEIEKTSTPYAIIEGSNAERLKNAAKALSQLTTLPDLSDNAQQVHIRPNPRP